MKHLAIVVILSAIACGSCAPYRYGPFNKEKEIHKVFQPILTFMDYKPGMTFADVGAASGAITVMMATLMDSSFIYIQDIDTTKFEAKNVDRIISYYSKQSKTDLRRKNKFQITIGDKEHSKLPNQSVDLIYTNATFHAFDAPDKMLADLHQKLKPNGKIFIRDGFKNYGAGSYCKDKTCGKSLMTRDEFLSIMDQNGFLLIKESSNLDGYPVFGFKIKS